GDRRKLDQGEDRKHRVHRHPSRRRKPAEQRHRVVAVEPKRGSSVDDRGGPCAGPKDAAKAEHDSACDAPDRHGQKCLPQAESEEHRKSGRGQHDVVEVAAHPGPEKLARMAVSMLGRDRVEAMDLDPENGVSLSRVDGYLVTHLIATSLQEDSGDKTSRPVSTTWAARFALVIECLLGTG